jgi:hypothetical protein
MRENECPRWRRNATPLSRLMRGGLSFVSAGVASCIAWFMVAALHLVRQSFLLAATQTRANLISMVASGLNRPLVAAAHTVAKTLLLRSVWPQRI